MDKIGIVIGDNDGMAKVAVVRSSGCGGKCSGCSGCSEVKPTIVYVSNEIGAKPGDQVEIESKPGFVAKFTIIMYAIPWLLFIAGLVGSIIVLNRNGVANYELYSFLIGLVALAVGFLILKVIDSKVFKNKKDMLRLVRVVE